MTAEEEMQAWQHWREACALSLISEADRVQLTTVIAQRFRSMLRKVNLHGMARMSAPPERDCAHLFETYCAMHQRRDGKKYKHWLLTRGRQDVDTVQSGVMLLVRNVVREWIRDAYPQTAALSLQQPLSGGGKPITFEELLPAPDPADRSAEQKRWIAETCTRILGEDDDLKRAVVILRRRGTVFSARGVREEFGYGKSILHRCHRAMMTELAEELRDTFPGVSPAEGAGMVLDLLDEVGRRTLSDSFVEKSRRSAFGEAKVQEDEW